jgi:hypothetical protein
MELLMVVWKAVDWAEQMGSQKAVCWADTKALKWADSKETQTAELMVVQKDVAKAGKTVASMAVTMAEPKAGRREEHLVARLVDRTVAKRAEWMVVRSVEQKEHWWVGLLVAKMAANWVVWTALWKADWWAVMWDNNWVVQKAERTVVCSVGKLAARWAEQLVDSMAE